MDTLIPVGDAAPGLPLPLAAPAVLAGISDLTRSPAWQLAIDDGDFARRDEMRAFRFAQEYAKVDLALRDWRIASTVAVIGSARIPSPDNAYAALAAAKVIGDREGVEAADLAAAQIGRAHV